MNDSYRNSFELDENARGVQGDPAIGLAIEIGDGPHSSPTAATSRGFTGRRAVRFALTGGRDGSGLLDDGLDVRVLPETELSYLVFPEAGAADRYASTAVAVDLRFDDGTRLSSLGIADQHASPLTAGGQAAGRALVVDQWNRVTVRIGERAAGKAVAAIILTLGDGSGAAAHGWIDDVSITIVPVPRLDGALTPADLVDTRRGTNSSRDFSRGNTIPATALPNGFNFVVPMTDARSEKWLYEYSRTNNADNKPVLQALGLSHQPSPWMGDRNQLAVMPALVADDGTVKAHPERRALAFDHADETARPHEYRVELENGIVAAATTTMRAVLFKFEFPGLAALVIDRVSGDSSFGLTDDDALEGWVDGGTSLSVGRSRMYVVGRFSQRPTVLPSDNDSSLVVGFPPGTASVELRLATSFLGVDQARTNLDELGGRGYEQVRDAARAAWNERLDVLSAQGATADQLVTLYSSLYRINLYPNWQHEHPAGDGPAQHASPVLAPGRPSSPTRTGAEVLPGELSVNHGFWDTYRTVWPAYSLLYPDLAGRLIDGFVQQYRESGWIARWSSPGHADLMTGTSSDAAFADAVLKGVPVSSIADVYDAALKNATVAPPDDSVGRKGQHRSTFLGYVDDSIHESVSWSTENCISDYAIAQLAAHRSRTPGLSGPERRRLADEAEYLERRSAAYANLHDPASGFLRPRDAEGRFTGPTPFDPEVWGGAYTETNAWTFAFAAPHDGPGLAALHGGTAGLGAMLDSYFSTPELADKPGSYGRTIHEMIEARDVRLGQFGMSNQPAHHIPYLYLYAGRPDAAQRIVRDVLRRLFRGSEIGQGYPGDEDNGEMSAWYVLSALGLYPLAVGSVRYAIGSPLFERVAVRLPGGADLAVVANDWSTENIYVQAVRFDGEDLIEPWIDHRTIARGGTLEFDLGPDPSSWGAVPESPAAIRPLHDIAVGSGPLFDDDSRTAAAFPSSEATILIAAHDRTAMPVMYTLTSSRRAGGDPAEWTLEGWSGSEWVTLDRRSDEEFRWRSQTRPFSISNAAACEAYRLRIQMTVDGAPLSLAQIELLAEAGGSPSRSTV